MKALIFLIPLFVVNACKTQTGTVISSENTNMEQVENKVGCPEEGACTVAVHKNKNLVIKEDGTGALYPEMVAGEKYGGGIYLFQRRARRNCGRRLF